LAQESQILSTRGPSSEGKLDVDAVAREFSATEDRLKQTERRTKENVDSVINELRYASCHLLRALCPEIDQSSQPDEDVHHAPPRPGEDPQKLEIRRAIDHCRRGRYDAVEYDTMTCLLELDLFKNDYRFVLGDDVPGLPAALKVARIAQRLVEDGKEPTRHKRRENGLDELEQECNSLTEAYRGLDDLRPVLNAKRFKNRLVLVGVFGACAGAAAAIAKLFMGS